MTDIEAKALNLPGSNFYKKTQLAYKSDINRDAFVVSLNHEAYKIFLSSILIGHYPALKSEELKIQEAQANGSFKFEKWEISAIEWQRMNYMNLENFYIATGFELHFKSSLLQNDFMVNKIDRKNPLTKTLAVEQEDRPIHKSELLALTTYEYDEAKQINTLSGVKNSTLDFSKLCTSVNYISALNKSPEIILIAENYRNLRNQIHLPGDVIDTTFINTIKPDELMKYIFDFINNDIVVNSNSLIAKWNLNYQPLNPLIL